MHSMPIAPAISASRRTDGAESHDSQRPASQFHSPQLNVRLEGIEPSTLHDVAVAFRDASRQCQYQPEGVFRHGLRVPSRRVDHERPRSPWQPRYRRDSWLPCKSPRN